MKQLKFFIELTRLKKPIGFMLLFWPCAWGLTLAYDFSSNLNNYFFFLTLFFLGSFLMRSAGCIVNDISDKKFDQKVQRTKNRPIASKKINVFKSSIYVITLCLLAFLILIQFNFFTILLGLTSMFLAFSYPFMKRITYWPQLFLGLTFNWGIIMAYTSINNIISLDAIILYSSAIFWTLGYDTIYGAQDIVDDEIIGMKSTSIKFKNNIKKFVSLCYLISSILILFLFPFNMSLQTLLMIFFISTLVYQILIFNKKKPKTCLKAFKINNISGLILFVAILSLSFNKGIL